MIATAAVATMPSATKTPTAICQARPYLSLVAIVSETRRGRIGSAGMTSHI